MVPGFMELGLSEDSPIHQLLGMLVEREIPFNISHWTLSDTAEGWIHTSVACGNNDPHIPTHSSFHDSSQNFTQHVQIWHRFWIYTYFYKCYNFNYNSHSPASCRIPLEYIDTIPLSTTFCLRLDHNNSVGVPPLFRQISDTPLIQ